MIEIMFILVLDNSVFDLLTCAHAVHPKPLCLFRNEFDTVHWLNIDAGDAASFTIGGNMD